MTVKSYGTTMFKNLCILFLLFSLVGCVAATRSNVDGLDRKYSDRSSTDYTFGGDAQEIEEVLREVLQQDGLQLTRDGRGIFDTPYVEVQETTMSAVDIALGAKVYKYSYHIGLREIPGSQTVVSVKVNLKVSQLVFIEQDENVPWLSNYLRQSLFEKVCLELNNGSSKKCDQFSSQKGGGFAEAPLLEDQTSGKDNSSTRLSKKGDKLVFKVQQALADYGYEPGPVDGLMGKKTRNALREFQQDEGLTTTGKIDDATLSSLDLADASEQNDWAQESEPELESHEEERPSEAAVNPAPKAKSKRNGTKKVGLIEAAELFAEKDPFSEVLTFIPLGEKVTVLGLEDDWYRVRYKNKEGFVSNYLIEEELEQQAEAVQTPAPKVKPVKEPVVLEEESPLESAMKSAPKIKPQKDDSKKVGLIEDAELFSGKDPFSEVLAFIPQGEKVTVLGLEDDWYRVRYKNKEGFISDYLIKEELGFSGQDEAVQAPAPKVKPVQKPESSALEEELQPEAAMKSAPKTKSKKDDSKKVGLIEDAELFSGKDPFSEVLAFISQGEKVTVLGLEDDWYRVRYKNKEGFISDYLIKEELGFSEQDEAIHAPTPKVKPAEEDEEIDAPVPAVEKVEPVARVMRGTIVETTSLLASPSIMADHLQDVPEGRSFKLLEKIDEFYRVVYNGVEGYIYIDFVELEK